jgi:hypothetical protein
MVESEPFSRLTRVDSLPPDGLELTIEANEAERAALAKRNGLPAIARLTAKFSLKRAGRGVVRVRGEVHAETTQSCVVSLEPVEAVLNEAIDVRFAPPPAENANRHAPSSKGVEVELAYDNEDEPDTIVDGKIDLGALAAEFMVLGLDPYPRKPGVDFTPPEAAADEGAAFFAALGAGSKKR